MKETQTKKPSLVKGTVLTSISAILLVAVIIGNTIAQSSASIINLYLGTTTYKMVKGNSNEDTEYFKSDFASEEELVAFEEELCATVEAEGATLLKNDNAALPLASGNKVSLFSHSSVDLMYGGTGSGQVDTSSAPNLKMALEEVGISINQSLWDFYSSEDISTNYSRKTAGKISDDYTNSTTQFLVNEVPWNLVEEANATTFAEYGDAAIVVLARSGGEGSDLPSGDNGSGLTWITSEEGNYLELTQEEKDMLAGLKVLKDNGTFKKIVVLLNSSNAIELDFLNPEICGVDYGVDACMWIGDVGQTGVFGVARLLAGEIAPSGSLADTFFYDNLQNPAVVNFYAQEYTNAADLGLGVGDYQSTWGLMKNYNVTNYYTVYQEGIYLGYRYFETRYEDKVMGTGNAGDFDYNKIVAYPFGYGMSYTTFDLSNYSVTPTPDGFDVAVTVTNTGDVAAKKTVQVYLQSPYTEYDKANGIEKASVELCGFDKTETLAPGESETLKIFVPFTELRTYDANNAETYILDAGDYYFTVANGTHEAVNNILAAKGYTTADGMDADGQANLTSKWVCETQDNEIFATSESTGVTITNLFDEADPNKASASPGTVTWLSRSDWEGTYPTTSQRNWAATQEMADQLAYIRYNPNDYGDVEMPTLGAKNDLTLAMMIGKDYNDPMWMDLLDQLTFDEMVECITLGFHTTAAVPSITKTATHDENGPQGLTASLMGGASAMCYTSEDVMAATFNTDLIYQVGLCIGEDCLAADHSGIYGPGINMHRTPYSGRNFEYFSEDPFLSGVICAAEVQGIQKKGVYVYMKHAALNDSETFRMGVSTWVNEQAAREIYLEPIATAIEDGGAAGIMSAFNRWGNTWSGAYRPLQIGFLREELGMQGISITDFSGCSYYMSTPDGLLGGSNLWDSSMRDIHTNQLATYKNDPVIVTAMRDSLHRILYTVANSNAMNGISTADRMKTVTPWWQLVIYGIMALAAIGTIAGIYMLVKANKARKNYVEH
jgi:beta-glucosidase